MVAFERLQSNLYNPAIAAVVYETISPVNLYDSAERKALATQAQTHRHLRLMPNAEGSSEGLSQSISALPVVLCEDDYPAWIALEDLAALQETTALYAPPNLSRAEIQARIPAAIAFAQAAMTQPNHYLWGGTLGPNYDCSGLVQHAFSMQGIWLPRDAYQQEAFVEPVVNPGNRPEDLVAALEVGDLIFFGTPVKATHVAIYLGEGTYIHSSGKDQGRNGIGLDILSEQGEQVSRNYYAQVRGAGRVVRSYISGHNSGLKGE